MERFKRCSTLDIIRAGAVSAEASLSPPTPARDEFLGLDRMLSAEPPLTIVHPRLSRLPRAALRSGLPVSLRGRLSLTLMADPLQRVRDPEAIGAS